MEWWHCSLAKFSTTINCKHYQFLLLRSVQQVSNKYWATCYHLVFLSQSQSPSLGRKERLRTWISSVHSSLCLHWVTEYPQFSWSPHLQCGPMSIWRTSGRLSHLKNMRTGGNNKNILQIGVWRWEWQQWWFYNDVFTCKVQLRKVEVTGFCAELMDGGP